MEPSAHFINAMPDRDLLFLACEEHHPAIHFRVRRFFVFMTRKTPRLPDSLAG